MSLRGAWRWVLGDLRAGFAALDPSKLMIAPILFFGAITVLDRAVYELEQSLFTDVPERPTRLSAADTPSPFGAAQRRSAKPSKIA